MVEEQSDMRTSVDDFSHFTASSDYVSIWSGLYNAYLQFSPSTSLTLC